MNTLNPINKLNRNRIIISDISNTSTQSNLLQKNLLGNPNKGLLDCWLMGVINGCKYLSRTELTPNHTVNKEGYSPNETSNTLKRNMTR